MCKVLIGADIERISDVQNLITSCILKKQSPFNIKTITEEVYKNCEGSSLSVSPIEINSMVIETIVPLTRTEYLDKRKNYYYCKVNPEFLENFIKRHK